MAELHPLQVAVQLLTLFWEALGSIGLTQAAQDATNKLSFNSMFNMLIYYKE